MVVIFMSHGFYVHNIIARMLSNVSFINPVIKFSSHSNGISTFKHHHFNSMENQ